MNIDELLAFGVKHNASDLHLSAGLPPMLRVDGDVRRINLPPMDHKEVHGMIYDIMNDRQRKEYEENLETDFSFAIPGLPSAAAALVPLITGVPVVGPVLADVMGAALEDRLYFAPAACKDGVTLVATAARLLSYATTWQRGVGVAFAAAWLAIGEARAGLGAQAAVQGAQVRVALGVSVVEAFAEAQAHVASLDLDATDRALADGIVEHGEVSLVDAAAAELDGPSLPLLRALKDAGASLALDVA